MSTEIRTHGDYDIIASVPTGEKNMELVIGAKPKDYRHPNDGYIEYVVWECECGENYRHGIYYINYSSALKRLIIMLEDVADGLETVGK